MEARHGLIGRIDFLWRLFATGLSFAAFGIGGIVFAFTVFPVIKLFVRDLRRRADLAQRAVHWMFRVFRCFMVTMGVIDFEAKDVENLRNDRGLLVVANHPTLLDVVLLMSLMDRAQCVVKHHIWSNPFMRGAVTAANYIRNDDDPEKLIADCSAALADGNNLIIFPEGSRTVPGRPRRLQRGFANVAVRSRSPVRLVTIGCLPPTLLKGEKWYRIPPRRPRFTVEIHEVVDPDRLFGVGPHSVAVRRLTAHIGARFEELLGNVGS